MAYPTLLYARYLKLYASIQFVFIDTVRGLETGLEIRGSLPDKTDTLYFSLAVEVVMLSKEGWQRNQET